MTDASAKDARTAWTIGGSLLIASALFPLVTTGVFVPGLGFVSTLLWAGSLLVFAFGVRRHGSVVARRPLGVTSLVIAALVPVVSMVFWNLVPLSPEGEPWAVPVGEGTQVVLLAALLVATVQIARAGIVPANVRRLPLILVVVAALAQVVVAAVAATAMPTGSDALTLLLSLAALVATGAQLVLGIAALVLAPRLGQAQPAEPKPVQVYPPKE